LELSRSSGAEIETTGSLKTLAVGCPFLAKSTIPQVEQLTLTLSDRDTSLNACRIPQGVKELIIKNPVWKGKRFIFSNTVATDSWTDLKLPEGLEHLVLSGSTSDQWPESNFSHFVKNLVVPSSLKKLTVSAPPNGPVPDSFGSILKALVSEKNTVEGRRRTAKNNGPKSDGEGGVWTRTVTTAGTVSEKLGLPDELEIIDAVTGEVKSWGTVIKDYREKFPCSRA
jgi:hypothetical protein